RLLQQQVHTLAGGRERQVGVGGDRCADHGDPSAGGVEERAEVGGLLGRAEAVRDLVGGQRGQLADACQPYDRLVLEAADVVQVPAAVAARARENDGYSD